MYIYTKQRTKGYFSWTIHLNVLFFQLPNERRKKRVTFLEKAKTKKKYFILISESVCIVVVVCIVHMSPIKPTKRALRLSNRAIANRLEEWKGSKTEILIHLNTQKSNSTPNSTVYHIPYTHKESRNVARMKQTPFSCKMYCWLLIFLSFTLLSFVCECVRGFRKIKRFSMHVLNSGTTNKKIWVYVLAKKDAIRMVEFKTLEHHQSAKIHIYKHE